MEIRTPSKTIAFGREPGTENYTLVLITPETGAVTEHFDNLQEALLFISVLIGYEQATLK